MRVLRCKTFGREMKVKVVSDHSGATQQCRSFDRSGRSLKDLSKSISVGTRKMVNYA
jgi:hypothetical protein